MGEKLKVVLALDDSETSQYALQWAMDHLLMPDVHSLSLLTVVSPPLQVGYYFAASAPTAIPPTSLIDDAYRQAVEEATRVISEHQATIEGRFGKDMECQVIIGRGEVRDEIVDYVESSKADLLVLGSRGIGALKRAFLGSTSDYCVHHCHCPVLIIKKP
jgi:nucleotide-binding universal stress UspA family protein